MGCDGSQLFHITSTAVVEFCFPACPRARDVCTGEVDTATKNEIDTHDFGARRSAAITSRESCGLASDAQFRVYSFPQLFLVERDPVFLKRLFVSTCTSHIIHKGVHRNTALQEDFLSATL